MKARLPVIAATALGEPRLEYKLAEGTTVEEIVETVLPGLPEDTKSRMRVTLVSPDGVWLVERHLWHAVRPKAGVQIVVRLAPGEDALRSALAILISIAAVALGQFWAPMLAGTLGLSANVWSTLISVGVSLIGNYLLSVLLPPAEQKKEKPTYAISGWRNEYRPDGPVPLILGRTRFAPPYGAMPWTEVVGDLIYQRVLFCIGYGPLALSELKIGDTPIEEYDECQVEVREGLPEDGPLTLYHHQVIEQQDGAELTRPLPRDDFGEVIEGEAEEIPIVRVSAADAAELGVIFGFPGGLVTFDKKGRKRNRTVSIRIRQRPVGDDVWQEVETIDITARKSEAVYRQYRWTPPARGRWEMDYTRMTPETDDTKISDRSVLTAIQSFRPEYPINFDKPLALVAIRVKATHQLNGTLDRFNLVASMIAPDWTGTEWVVRESRSPAAAYRRALEGPAVRFPSTEEQVNLEELEDWAEFCADKGLKYDRAHDFEGALLEGLSGIAASGRAAPRHDGRKWSVVIDRPRTLVVDHLNPRNSRSFRWRRPYFTPPDAYRVPFIDASNEFQSAERIVPWPPNFRIETKAALELDLAHRAGVTAEVYDDPGNDGYYVKVGDIGAGWWEPKQIVVTEEIQMPGKVDPDEIWIETRRRQYAAIHRPDVITAVQDGAVSIVTRGDLVMGSWDTLDRTMHVARVVAVRGRLVELDSPVTMEAGESYAIRWRVFSEADTIGQSIVRTVKTVVGERRTVTLVAGEVVPEAGMIVHFGRSASDSLPLIVAGIEPGDDMASVLTMQAMVPLIDELTDAEVPPPWDGRVGEIISPDLTTPGVPAFTSISSGVDGTGIPNAIEVTLVPGSGVAVARFDLEHRVTGAGSWSVVSIPLAAGGSRLTYAFGTSVQLRARAFSRANVPGGYTGIVTVVVGSGDVPVPAALPEESITVIGKLGHAEIVFATGTDVNTTHVLVYRDGEPVGAPIPVSPLGTFGRIDGDSTRTNLLPNGDLDNSSGIALGAGFSVGAGTLNAAAGSISTADQSVPTLPAGATVRLGFDITAYSAGNVRTRLSGPVGPNNDGPDRTAVGTYVESVVLSNDRDTYRIRKDAAFVGSLDNLRLFIETPSCIAQGEHDYELEPLNEDEVAGPRSALRTVTVI